MHWFKLKIITALAAWAVAAAGQDEALHRNWPRGICPRGVEDLEDLVSKLSKAAEIFFPGSTEFEEAVLRWSALSVPKINVVVVPSVASDVAETVKFANRRQLPFLAYNSAHGAITTLGKMTSGIEIYLSQLDSFEIAADGKTATIGGGILSKAVTDKLYAAGKQTGESPIMTGTCECVGLLGPALGGGHGWLQGYHGLVADQFVSLDVVLADGSMTTVDANSDLWWAMKGAGHNFGIVTSVTTKIYDIQYTDWAIETLIFSGDKVAEVYRAANDHLLENGTQPENVINWSYWLNDPAADPSKPVILFYIIQGGVKAVDTVYTKAFHDIGPLSVQPASGTYQDLANWTGIAMDSPPCQKAGLVNPRFPIYLGSYDVSAQKKAYDLFASQTSGNSAFNGSIFMIEGYSTQGVRAVDAKSTAFAFRDEHILAAPLITYVPTGPKRDQQAAQLGNQLRQILFNATGQKNFGAYVNYAYGDETPQGWYGSESWRQARLQALKKKYDPEGKFSFFAPIA